MEVLRVIADAGPVPMICLAIACAIAYSMLGSRGDKEGDDGE